MNFLMEALIMRSTLSLCFYLLLLLSYFLWILLYILAFLRYFLWTLLYFGLLLKQFLGDVSSNSFRGHLYSILLLKQFLRLRRSDVTYTGHASQIQWCIHLYGLNGLEREMSTLHTPQKCTTPFGEHSAIAFVLKYQCARLRPKSITPVSPQQVCITSWRGQNKSIVSLLSCVVSFPKFHYSDLLPTCPHLA